MENKSRGSYSYIRKKKKKTDFKLVMIRKDKAGHYIVIKNST